MRNRQAHSLAKHGDLVQSATDKLVPRVHLDRSGYLFEVAREAHIGAGFGSRVIPQITPAQQ